MDLVSEFARTKDAAVIAPAGCGKTNLIAEAAAHFNSGHELILTHTHAGVYAVRNRLRQFGANPNSYVVDTIAGWSLRYTAAFPAISGVTDFVPGISGEWDDVYQGMIKLLENEVVQRIIGQSYSGIYVDEYQDCLKSQHQIIRRLAGILPCRIVGDPLQSIFGFGQNQLADWDSEVMTSFNKIGELNTPWRWSRTNPELGQWLQVVRSNLMTNRLIDLQNAPKSVRWIPTSDGNEQRKSYWRIGNNTDQVTCIIHAGWERQCHSLARGTGGFFNSMETIECKDLFTWASGFNASHGLERAKLVCEFAGDCFSGVKTTFRDISKRLGSKAKKTGSTPNDVFALLEAVANEKSVLAISPALEAIRKTPGVKLFRGELYYEMCRTLTEHSSGDRASLQESALVVRDRTRQFGRRMSPRTVSRTLLIKGLEFDNCMIIGADNLDRNNLYVALTRASKTLVIVSKEPKLMPT